LRSLTAANEAKLFDFASSRMSEDQLYFVAVLPQDGENALSPELTRIALKRLNDLKINSFLNDGLKYGVVYTDLTDLSFGSFKAGDIFMIQKNSRTKNLSQSGSSILGENQNVMVSKILDQELINLLNYSLGKTLRSISSTIF
jgi:hypothetical protein